MNNLIELSNISKIFYSDKNVKVLKKINYNFKKGKIYSLMGPSGSGKSTLLHCLAGLDRPTSGQIFLKEEDISTLNDKQLTKIRRDSFGFVFQAFNLIPPLTITRKEINELLSRLDKCLMKLS